MSTTEAPPMDTGSCFNILLVPLVAILGSFFFVFDGIVAFFENDLLVLLLILFVIICLSFIIPLLFVRRKYNLKKI